VTLHNELWNELRARIAKSIDGAADPLDAAGYAANALMEWPEGLDLLRRILEEASTRS
jgi:hypothetical protein